jgi:hypothetical protein
MPELSQTVLDLRREWGLDFLRVRHLLTELATGGTLTELVSVSGLPRRDVESILHTLSPFLMEDGDRHTLPALKLPKTSNPDEATLTVQMTEVARDLPSSRWRLDHVPAMPLTMARRGLYLAGTYELDGASVLCLGDHDLTSLAVGLVTPEAELTVVDIDEPILDHVTESAPRLGFHITAAWADLRLALPPSLVGTADLVFTDPPYTTEGMRLFLTRGLEALRPTGHERLAFCFGTGERHLVKALEVQALLGDLRLALEAMLPGFNHYDGAEAIGARSDLYICRPTKGAKVGEELMARHSRRRRGVDFRIYTRGPSSREAGAQVLPEEIAAAAVAAAGEGPVLLVGEGWTAGALAAEERSIVLGAEAGDRAAVALPAFFARVAAWATAARPGPFPFAGTLVINTHPDYGGAALRTLLLAASERAVLIVPRRNLPDPDLLASAYDITTIPAGPGGDPAVIVVTRHDRAPADPAEAVLRRLLLHPGAKVVNAWRDALLDIARDAGQPMTKNEARARISADTLLPSLRRLRAWELPLSALRALRAEVARRALAE